MKIFDSHCHLDDKRYRKDIARVIERAHQNSVTRMMTVGVNKKTAERAVELAESHPGIYASLGFHPHDASQCGADELDFLTELAQNPRVKAWGEIGLDYNRMYSPRQDQERWFIRQLKIAAELNFPSFSMNATPMDVFLRFSKPISKTKAPVSFIVSAARHRNWNIILIWVCTSELPVS